MEDTIAAISTAYGEGGIGIIRISGEHSGQILNKIFQAKAGDVCKPRHLTYGHIVDIYNENKIIDEVLAAFGEGDLLLLQNEINGIPRLIENAHARGMRIVLNPSPYDEVISECDLSKVSILLVNEIEGWQISAQRKPDSILEVLAHQYPELAVVLTLGSQGVVYQHQSERFSHGIYPVPVVDTTAAGDTFTGYFLAGMTRGLSVPQSLELASKASSIAVTRHGAAPSIPLLREVESYAF